MNKSCESTQRLLARLLRGELDIREQDALEAHLSGCGDCRSALDFERSLESRLSERVELPPDLLADARRRVADGSRPVARPSWTERIFGRTLMRKMLVSGTALAVLFVVAFALFPSAARAVTARETFRQMKAALAASRKEMEITVVATVTPDNHVTATVDHDGNPTQTPLNVKVGIQRQGNRLTANVEVGFDESDYSKIAFGKDKNTLELTPKAQADRKYEVAINGKSKLPLTWTAYAKNGKAWKKLGADRFVYREKKATAGAPG